MPTGLCLPYDTDITQEPNQIWVFTALDTTSVRADIEAALQASAISAHYKTKLLANLHTGTPKSEQWEDDA